MSLINFRNIKTQDADAWFIANGFVKQPDGSWSKPKRTVPRVRKEACPEPESSVPDAQIHKAQREAIYPGRVLVSVTSYCCGTQRDSDNICPKYFLDCCRYAGLIRDDCPGTVQLTVKEERVSTKKEEGCEIVIMPL